MCQQAALLSMGASRARRSHDGSGGGSPRKAVHDAQSSPAAVTWMAGMRAGTLDSGMRQSGDATGTRPTCTNLCHSAGPTDAPVRRIARSMRPPFSSTCSRSVEIAWPMNSCRRRRAGWRGSSHRAANVGAALPVGLHAVPGRVEVPMQRDRSSKARLASCSSFSPAG